MAGAVKTPAPSQHRIGAQANRLSIREELLAEVEPLYWELTDRGVNFAYLPPERRARVAEFFEWFGNRLD